MLSFPFTCGFFGNYLCIGQIVASVAQAPLVPALHQQGGSVEPPESFAYQDKPGTLSPCGADSRAGIKTCTTFILQDVFAKKMAVAIFS